MPKRIHVILTAAGVLMASLALAQTEPPSQTRNHPRQRIKEGPGTEAAKKRLSELSKSARDAEASGDFASAERVYKQIVALDPRLPFSRINLARLYDKMGRDRDAYVEYRAVILGVPGAWSSDQQDPRNLARFGDLCARFSTLDEAQYAYALSVANSDSDDVWEPSPRIDSPKPSFARLKSAAHTASAIKYGASGRDAEAFVELESALKADPDYWVALFYRAQAHKRAGRLSNATRDAALAERLANSKGRAQVRWLRRTQRIPDLGGKLLPILPATKPGIMTAPPDSP